MSSEPISAGSPCTGAARSSCWPPGPEDAGLARFGERESSIAAGDRGSGDPRSNDLFAQVAHPGEHFWLRGQGRRSPGILARHGTTVPLVASEIRHVKFLVTRVRGRCLIPAASKSTTSAMRAARSSGRRVVALIQRRYAVR
jgi:hypothetical protein